MPEVPPTCLSDLLPGQRGGARALGSDSPDASPGSDKSQLCDVGQGFEPELLPPQLKDGITVFISRHLGED